MYLKKRGGKIIVCEYCEEEKALHTRKREGKLQYIMNITNYNGNSKIFKVQFLSRNINNVEKLLFQCNLNYCPFCGRKLSDF